MAISLGNNYINKIKLGVDNIETAYLGVDKIFPGELRGIANIVPVDFSSSNTMEVSSTSGFTVDWGDGNPISYSSGILVSVSSVASGNIIVDGIDINVLRFKSDTFKEINLNDATTITSMFNICPNLTSLEVFSAENTGNVTFANNAFANCTGLTSFPLIDTSGVGNFTGAWFGCTGLTSFPAIDTSSATVFSSTWRDCTSLTSFPLIDTSAGTNFTNTWFGLRLLTSFPAIDTSSGTDFPGTFNGCSRLVCLSQVNTLLQTTTHNMLLGTTDMVAPTTSQKQQILDGFNYINPNPCP